MKYKTLEEITSYNNSLKDSKFKISKEYFAIRKSIDNRLSNLASTNADKKEELVYSIKRLKNISLQKIDFNISLYKKRVKQENIELIAEKAFNSMTNEFKYDCHNHYEKHKETIINYMIEMFKMRLEFKKYSNEINKELQDFIKDNKISTYRLKALVHLYNEKKADLKLYKKKCENLTEFQKYQQEKEELRTIAEQFFLEEVEAIDKQRELDKIVSKIKEDEDIEYTAAMSREYTPKVGNDPKELVVSAFKTEQSIENMLLANKDIAAGIDNYCKKPVSKPKKKYTKEEKTINRLNKESCMKAFKSMIGKPI